jgi:hypothetical protein
MRRGIQDVPIVLRKLVNNLPCAISDSNVGIVANNFLIPRSEHQNQTLQQNHFYCIQICNTIGWDTECVVEAYKEAIDWFGGNEALGLRETYRSSYSIRGWRAPRITVRIPEIDGGVTKYRSLSAPISASTQEELMQRFEKIRQLSPLHQRAKLEI